MDLGLTVEAVGERREGRHRSSGVRAEKGVRRRNGTRRTRAHPRRVAQAKAREGVRGERRVNLRQVQGNARGQRGRERPGRPGGLGTEAGDPSRPRLGIGIDEGERVEQGRASFSDRRAKTRAEVVGRRHSHAPVTTEANLEARRTAERRRPRKTWVEADQRRTNLEGKPVWTTGVGGHPTRTRGSREGSTQAEAEIPEARSDPSRGGAEAEARTHQRKTRGVKTRDGAWNQRRRPDRYEYHREGHPRARASKVMARCSKTEGESRGQGG